jgi:hypothetical protein
MLHRDTTILRTAAGAAAGYVGLGLVFPRVWKKLPLPRKFRSGVHKALYTKSGILGKYQPDVPKVVGAIIGAEAVKSPM